MATANPTITPSYTKLVDAGLSFWLSFIGTDIRAIELVTTEADAAPAETIIGHPIDCHRRESVNRALTGPGYVWARTRNGETGTVALTTE